MQPRLNLNGSRIVLTGDLQRTQIVELTREFTYRNPDHEQAVKRSRWGKAPRGIPETLCTMHQTREGWTFPLGALERVKTIVPEAEQEFDYLETLGDARWRAELKKHPFVFKVTPRDFQEDQIRTALAHRCTLFRAPPGSGKTTTALGFIARAQLPALVACPSEKIFEQWIRRAVVELGMRERDVGVIRGSTRNPRPLTIAMAQTLKNCASDYADMFGVFVGDEVHRHGAETFGAVTDKMRARYRIGVSADERRADGKEFLIYDLFGPVRHEVSRDEMVQSGFIVDAHIVVVPTECTVPWYSKMLPRQRSQGMVQTRLLKDLAGDEARNDLITRLMSACLEVGEPTLVLAKHVEHCLELRARAVRASNAGVVGLMLGGAERKREFEFARGMMEDGTLQLAVGTYQAVGTGFDLPKLSQGVFAMPVANSPTGQMQFAQFCGRYERPSFDTGKRRAVVYYLWDQHVFGLRPIQNLMRWKKNVQVEVNGELVPAKQFVRDWREGAAQSDDEVDGLFARGR